MSKKLTNLEKIKLFKSDFDNCNREELLKAIQIQQKKCETRENSKPKAPKLEDIVVEGCRGILYTHSLFNKNDEPTKFNAENYLKTIIKSAANPLIVDSEVTQTIRDFAKIYLQRLIEESVELTDQAGLRQINIGILKYSQLKLRKQ